MRLFQLVILLSLIHILNRANEVRPIFRSLGDIAQATGCAIVLIGHLNKAAGTQSTYRGLGSIDITAAVRSLLFIGKLKDRDVYKRQVRYCSMSWCYPTSSLSIAPRLTKRHETAWS